MGQQNPKYFRDPIHGYIEIDKEFMPLIDSPYFQRLRRVKQLAFTDLVYHGAEHSRFGHSLGAFHLASRLTDSLNIRSKERRNEFRLAALLHDIGHPPYSHAFESALTTQGERYKHENFTQTIILETEIGEIIEKLGYSKDTVAKLVEGQFIEDPNFSFLNDLISSELDVDRLDFLLRDSYFCGVPYGQFDIQRLLMAIKKKNNRILIDEKARHAAEGFILARFWMYTQVYTHHTRRAFDVMLKAAFPKEIIKAVGYPAPNKKEIHNILNFDDAWLSAEIRNGALFKKLPIERSSLASELAQRRPLKYIIEKIAYTERGTQNTDDEFAKIESIAIFKEDIAKRADISPDLIFFDEPWKDLPFEEKYRQYTHREEKEGSAINLICQNGDIRDIALDSSSLAYNISKYKARVVRIYTIKEKRSELSKVIAERIPALRKLIVVKKAL